ncbi:MAG TPA: carboxypeptidase regulatory-like domain-containing protein [Candidatus Angelobacter sp.]|nr:carboxypeptidase regulatory-like domain-containing protein [Candidatus Angelobacter sp.]
MKKVAFSPWLLLLVLLAFTVAAFGQNTASIKGTVTDSSGAAVVGANITVKNADLGFVRTTQSNAAGDYEVPALKPGRYSVEVQMKGFQPQQAKNVILEVSKNSVQNFKLGVAAASETVTVEATAPVIESTTMTVGQTIDQRTVQEIPLNGRHFVDLALLIPGTVTPPQNGFLTAPLRGQGSFAFNTAGNREDSVNFMINGINLNDMVQNQVTFQPTINTVSEFKVDNSTYSAEYGRNSGAIVNIATRSGTNEFHGEAYDYLRNDFFDARNAFNPKTVTDSNTGLTVANPMASFKRNQFGGDFGGPIIHDKTFFFLSYEGLRQRQGLPFAANVLDDPTRAAIQSGTNPVAKALLNLIPQANGSLNNAPAFLGSGVAPVDIDQGTADIFHKISDKDTLHGYYVYQRDHRIEAAAGTSLPGFGDTRDGHRQVLTLNESHIVSSTVVNEARIGANRILINFTPNNTTDPASLGLASALGPNETFMPTIVLNFFSNPTTFGAETGFPQGRGDTTFVLADTVSWINGRHSWKFGTEWRDFRNDNFNGDPGSLTFNSITSFENDTPDNAARTVGNVANRINQAALDFFAQDSFKFKPYLTLELGLRYAWNMTPSEAQDRFVNFDATTVSLIPVSQPYAQNSKNFQPRVGFSYDVFRNGNTILRGGYAYQVDQPITGFVTGLNSNPPFALPISVTATSTIAALTSAFNGTPSTISPIAVNPNFRNADVQSWNLNVQQQIGRNTALMVGYFGTKGTHLEIDRNINQFTIFGNSGSRPFGELSASSPILPATGLGNITEIDSSSNSNYNALWVTLDKHLSKNLQFNASYTWSHSIDDVSRDRNGIVVPDSFDIASGRGSSDFDARHRFVVNAIYNLPFTGNRAVSGWEVATIVSAQSGNPFTIVIPSSGITGVRNTVTPIVLGAINVSGNPLGQWIVPTGVDASGNPSFANTFQIPTTTLGNLGRNSIYGPGFEDADLSLVKNTKVTEKMNVQFRVDAFDLLNHPNYGQPGRVLSRVTGTPTQIGSLFTINSTRFPTGDSGSSRQLQLALKLQF